MNRFTNIFSKSPVPIIPKATTVPSTEQAATSFPGINPKKLQKMYKSGPELLITRILMIYGPLQNKEIWRIYTRMLKDNAKSTTQPKIEQELKSLTHMKRIIKFMVDKEKLKSAGYDKKAREHKGWEVITDKALKRVHPQAIESIQKAISAKDVL